MLVAGVVDGEFDTLGAGVDVGGTLVFKGAVGDGVSVAVGMVVAGGGVTVAGGGITVAGGGLTFPIKA